MKNDKLLEEGIFRQLALSLKHFLLARLRGTWRVCLLWVSSIGDAGKPPSDRFGEVTGERLILIYVTN